MLRNRWIVSLVLSAPLFSFSPRSFVGNVVSGIFSADFRETPIGELFPLQSEILPPIPIMPRTDHPRLLLRPGEAAFIRGRMYRLPYREWADRILSSATESPDPTSPLLPERERSRIAKQNAFAWILTGDTHYLQTAVQAMRHMADLGPIRDLEGGIPGLGWGDFMETAEALRHYTVAWDLVVDRIPPEERQGIESRLFAQAERLSRYRFLIPKNNHAVVVGTGLGTAALGLDHPRAADWLEIALGQIRAGLSQIEPDGTYREGAYYGRFIASHLAPFAYYLYRQTGINLLLLPRLRLFFRWLDDIALPDGSVPDFDDAFPETFLYEPIVAGLLPDLWIEPSLSTTRCRRDDPDWIEAYCAFEGNRAKSSGKKTSVVYPYGGMAIFREGDLTALFLGERGRPHLSGHDHVEPGALTLWAFGTPLLLDAGYGPRGVEDPNRAWYTSAQAHNIPLVDGLGPDQNPVWGDELGASFSDHWVTSVISAASVRMSFRGARFLRRVWFVGGRFFVVSDRMEADRPCLFSVSWHGAGRLEDFGGNRLRWVSDTPDHPFLEAWLLTPETTPLSLETRTGLHTRPIPGVDHTTIRVHLPPSRTASLTTLLCPGRNPDRTVEVMDIPLLAEGKGSAKRIRYSDSENDWIITAETPWQCGPLESDGGLVIYREADASGVEAVVTEEASYLRIAGETRFVSSVPITLGLIRDGLGVYGHLVVPERVTTRVSLRLPADPGIIFIDRQPISYEWSYPWARFDISRGGLFEIGPPRNQIRETETIHENLPLLRRLAESKLSNPAWDLTPAERIVLQNEIVRLVGIKSLEAADSAVKGIGLTGAYGLASGLLTSLFGQSGRMGGGIPQKVEWDQTVSRHHLRYREEGFIAAQGWRIHRQRLVLNDRIWLTQERPFSGCITTEASIYTDAFAGNLRHETSPFGQQKGIFVRRETQGGWMAASWRSGTQSGRSGLFSLSHGPWLEEILLGFPKDKEGFTWQGRLRHQTGHEATQFRLWGKRDAWQGIGIDHTRRLWHEGNLGGSWKFYRDPLGRLHSLTSLQSHLAWGAFGGRLSAEKDGDRPLKTGWLARFASGAWRIDTQGELTPRCLGHVGVVYQTRRGSFRLLSHRAKRWETEAVLNPRGSWIPTIRTAWTRENRRPESMGFALYKRGEETYGGEFRVLWEEDRVRLACTGIAFFPIRPHEWIFGYLAASTLADGKDPQIELRLRQVGTHLTPGLYLLIDPNRCIRFEGFLAWQL